MTVVNILLGCIKLESWFIVSVRYFGVLYYALKLFEVFLVLNYGLYRVLARVGQASCGYPLVRFREKWGRHIISTYPRVDEHKRYLFHRATLRLCLLVYEIEMQTYQPTHEHSWTLNSSWTIMNQLGQRAQSTLNSSWTLMKQLGQRVQSTQRCGYAS